MLWVTAVSDGTLYPGRDLDNDIFNHARECAKVAVRSAVENTSFEVAVIYNGNSESFMKFLENQGALCIQSAFSHRDDPSFYPDLSPFNRSKAAGAWIRTDLPLHFPDHKYVVYTDCDVVFCRDVAPVMQRLTPEYLSAVYWGAPAYGVDDYFNTGVMVVNIENFAKEREGLYETSRREEWGGIRIANDEGCLNLHFDGRVDPMHKALNWRPWWGIYPSAGIVHYHGSKIEQLVEYLEWGTSSPDLPDYCRGLWRKGGGACPDAVEMTPAIASHYVKLYEKYAGAEGRLHLKGQQLQTRIKLVEPIVEELFTTWTKLKKDADLLKFDVTSLVDQLHTLTNDIDSMEQERDAFGEQAATAGVHAEALRDKLVCFQDMLIKQTK
tara:strand:- start:17328 stop:18473 length:1146 start_codon:yes stop_codon:yes gene_type:complete